MDLLLDVKILIARYDVNVWLKLYRVDEAFRHYTLSTPHFNQLFKKESPSAKRTNLMLIYNYNDQTYHLCNNITLTCSGLSHRRSYHYIGKCIFTNVACEMIVRKNGIIYYE
jgi:hypothetical protein